MTDYLEAVAAVFDSMAWPVAVVVAIWILREPLSGLISMITDLKYKDLAVTFQRKAEHAREAVPLEEGEDQIG